MLKEFAEKERLKDHLLYIIKQDEKNVINTNTVEPTSDIITRIFTKYEEILEKNGEDRAGGYLFNVMASYILLSTELVALNKKILETNKQLIELLPADDKD